MYNSIEGGLLLRYMAYKINPWLNFVTNNKYHFKKILKIKTCSLTRHFTWLVTDSDPPACLLMEL